MTCTILTKHVISCSGSVRRIATDCNVNNKLHPIIFLEKKRNLLKRIHNHNFFNISVKWKKTNESVCPMNALENIVLLMSLLNVLFNVKCSF